MQKITIAIPDDMDATQKAELTAWLQMKVTQASPDRLPCEDDPMWQAQATERIRAGMDDVKNGRVLSSTQARQRLTQKLGLANSQ